MTGTEIHAQLLENLSTIKRCLRRPAWAPLARVDGDIHGTRRIADHMGGTAHLAASQAAALLATRVASPCWSGGSCVCCISGWNGMLFDALIPALESFRCSSAYCSSRRWQKRRVNGSSLERMVHEATRASARAYGRRTSKPRNAMQTGMPAPRRPAERRSAHRPVRPRMITGTRGRRRSLRFLPFGSTADCSFWSATLPARDLSASIFMAVSKALYKSAALNATAATTGDLMTSANIEVSRDNSEMFFVTAFRGHPRSRYRCARVLQRRP